MVNNQRFYFCPKCGGKLNYRRRDRLRLVCQSCEYIMYENPIVGVAAIVMQQNKILLGRRNSGCSYAGLWCIPCGYVEYDEDVYSAVKREFYEETGLEIQIDGIFTVLSNFHNPEVHTVGIWFNASISGGEISPGDDLDKVDFFSLQEIPALAFPTDAMVIDKLINEI